jgi:hypothetical protein
MEKVYVITGIACILAAIVGGGLRFFDVTLPLLTSIPRQILLCILGVGLIVSPRFERLKPYLGLCPLVEGTWLRETDNLVMLIEQNGCSITCRANNATFDHLSHGTYDRSTHMFSYVTARRNIQQECTTQMFGTFRLVDRGLIKGEVTGTDGRCDKLPTFKESSDWVKQ